MIFESQEETVDRHRRLGISPIRNSPPKGPERIRIVITSKEVSEAKKTKDGALELVTSRFKELRLDPMDYSVDGEPIYVNGARVTNLKRRDVV